MKKVIDVIGKALSWLRTFTEEISVTATLDSLTARLDAVDKLREELVKGYGADYATMAKDLSIAMTAFAGTADQKKTLKRSLKRAVRRATNAKYTLAFKRDTAEVVPYVEETKSVVQRAFDTLSEYVPDETIQTMVDLFNAGMAALEVERERIAEQAAAAAKRLQDEQVAEELELAEKLLKRAGVEISEATLEITRKLVAANK